MKKMEWIIVYFPLVITWGLDRVTKNWATGLIAPDLHGYFAFILHHNPGAMLGLFSELPAVLRIVSLSTGGAFLVCTYALIQYLLPIKSLALRSGMSILLGGILGNVTDRIIWGHVVDFIVIMVPNKFYSPAFNVADALQWVGYALIVWAIVREGEILWPENNARKVLWVNPKFQLKYCFFLMGAGLGVSLMGMVFAYTYLRVTMLELVGGDPHTLDRFLVPFAITAVVISVGFSAILFTVGKMISHKIAGPIYAFEKYMNDVIENPNSPASERQFKLRSQDEFKELESLALKLKAKLAENQKTI